MQEVLLDSIRAGARVLVVDLEKVNFMDSSGLRVLISGLKALHRQGGEPLKICRANAQIRTALRLTMLDKVFPMFQNVEDAFESVSPATLFEND